MSRHGPYRSAPAHPSIHRNVWSGPIQCSDSRSTQSSGSSHTYHVLNGPHYYQEPLRPQAVHGSWRGRHPLDEPKYLVARPPHHLLIVDNGGRSRPVSSRAVTPVSGQEASPAIVPCGGHCQALENFCHYFLQVVFLGGVLCGLCLVVAGSLLRAELAVLTYIGSLAAMVSGVLLWVQCMVRRGPPRHRGPRPPEAIPLQNLHHQPPRPPQPQPLDFRKKVVSLRLAGIRNPGVMCLTTPTEIASSLKLIPQTEIRRDRQEIKEESGIPWWRRENMVT